LGYPQASFESGRIVWEIPGRATPRRFWEFDVFEFPETADDVMGEVIDDPSLFRLNDGYLFLVEVLQEDHRPRSLGYLYVPEFTLTGVFAALLQAILNEKSPAAG